MLVEILLLLVGLALIIKGGDWFVSAAVHIAELLNMPRVVIGSTLVSLTTTSPELVVSIVSGLKKESGLAVGNAVGSCICNIALILALSAVIRHIAVHPRILRTPLVAMLLSGVLLLVLTMDLSLQRWQGFLLLGLGAVYFIYDFQHHMRAARPSQHREARIVGEQVVSKAWKETPWGATLQFLFGALVVIVGSKLLVDSAVGLASRLGVPSIVIGLSVVAVGTSLPEFVTAITSARRNVSDLAVGNVLGANVANLTLVVGSAAAINDVTMVRFTQLYNFPAMLLLMLFLGGSIVFFRGLSRRSGLFMIGFYILYLTGLFATVWLIRSSAS